MARNHRGEYPSNWAEIAKQVKADAGGKCVRCGHAHEPATAQDVPPAIGEPWQEVAEPPTLLKHRVALPVISRR